MDNEREQIPQHILQDIRQNFKFMFDRGYEIVSTHYFSGYYDGYWEVLFGSPDFSLKIVNDQGLSLSFGSSSKGYINIGALIHYLSGETEVPDVSTMKNVANQLGRYIDEIENRFQVDYAGLEKEVSAAEKKLEGTAQESWKSLSLRILAVPYILLAVMFFKLWNELVFDGLLSGLLADLGYSSSSWLIRSVSLLLAIGSVYITHRLIQKSDESAENVGEWTSQTHDVTVSKSKASRRNPILMAIIFFPLFWVAFAFLIGAVLSAIPSSHVYDIVFPILTFGLSFLLALWIASSIYESNRG